MGDVVVTIPNLFLSDWIAEGDPAEAPWSGREWHFYLCGDPPRIEPGERVYIVYNGALRGYAPLVRIDRFEDGHYSLVRHGEAVAVSITQYIPNFRGFQYRWWRRSAEKPFPSWRDPMARINKCDSIDTIKELSHMTPDELIVALRKLDKLYLTKGSFNTWLTGDTQASSEYEQVKQRIEAAFPGLHVVQVDITYKFTHALVVGN